MSRKTTPVQSTNLPDLLVTAADLCKETPDFVEKTDFFEAEIIGSILYVEAAKRLTHAEFLQNLANRLVESEPRLSKKGYGKEEIRAFVKEVLNKPLEKWSEDLFENLTFLFSATQDRKSFSRFYLKNILLKKEPPKASNCASNRMLARMLGFEDAAKTSAYTVFEDKITPVAKTLRILFLIQKKFWLEPLTLTHIQLIQQHLFPLVESIAIDELSDREKDDLTGELVLFLHKKKEQFAGLESLSGVAYETIIDTVSSFKTLYYFYLVKDFDHFVRLFAHEKNQSKVAEDLIAKALKEDAFDLEVFSTFFKLFVQLLKGGGVSKICQILMKDRRFVDEPQLEELFRAGVVTIESNASLRTIAIVCGKHYQFQHPILNWLLRRLLLTSPADYNGFLRMVVNDYTDLVKERPDWLIRLFRAQAVVWKYTASANLNYMVMAGHRELAETVYQSIQEILGDARRPYLLLTRDNIDFGDLTLREELS